MLDRGFVILSLSASFLAVTSFTFGILAISLRLRHVRRAREWDRLVARWEPAILEALSGGDAPLESVHERVGAGEGPDFLSFLMTYVRRLRGDEQALVRALAEPYLPTLLPRVRRGAAESRGNAVSILARIGMPRYADVVAQALDDESPVVSMLAARSLFRPGHERHFPQVLEHLPRYATWSRSLLAGMLAGGGAGAGPPLRAILLDREQPSEVRAVAADALRNLNDIDSVPIALDVLESESDREVLAACIRILAHLGHADHVPALRSMAASLDPLLRSRAVSALGQIGGPAEVPLLREKLDDPSFWVSLEAARGMIALGDRGTLQRLAATRGPWSTLANQVLSE